MFWLQLLEEFLIFHQAMRQRLPDWTSSYQLEVQRFMMLVSQLGQAHQSPLLPLCWAMWSKQIVQQQWPLACCFSVIEISYVVAANSTNRSEWEMHTFNQCIPFICSSPSFFLKLKTFGLSSPWLSSCIIRMTLCFEWLYLCLHFDRLQLPEKSLH